MPQEISKGITELGTSATSGAAQVSKSFGDAAASLTQSFSELNKAVAAAGAASMGPGAGEIPAPINGQASGGYISGPGSGTSDSILARLSNGEFVLNAGSVRRLGIGYLRALNTFADGGLVGMPPIRFAEGGLMGAGGGQAVHLHLGSQSFALSGSPSIVSALVTEAHAQQMRSAGTKPSWFAGRPGGR